MFIKKEIIDLFNKYQGLIKEYDNEISITSITNQKGYNVSNRYYTLSLRWYIDKGKTSFFISGYEAGYFSGFTDNFSYEKMEKYLKKYGFLQKSNVQLDLFDYVSIYI